MGSDALARRLVRWRGGDPRRRAVGPRCRQRHCGLLAQPGALQWRLWPQADLGADLDARPCAARHLDADRHIRGRPDGAPRRGPRSGAARLAGPDLLQRAAWRVELPPPRRRRLGEFSVAVWASSPLCRIDTSVCDLFDRAIATVVRAGATVDDAARPGIGDEEHHRLFMLLLRAATASRMRDEDLARQQEIAATLSDDDMSDRAAVERGATLLHRAWGTANEARTKLRYNWHEFFKRFDVLLTPVAASGAFPHDHNADRDARTVKVNGRSVPYAEQLFFAGLASLSYLPATAAPIGLTGEGLPVGLQIVGPEGEDPTTIEFARLLAAEIGGFVPPPAYR